MENKETSEATTAAAEGMSTGQVRWYSGSRGVGLVDTEGGAEVMAFLPGAVQEDLGGIKEGDAVAVNPAGGESDCDMGNLFPLELDRKIGGESG